jgi:hypothetical protein
MVSLVYLIYLVCLVERDKPHEPVSPADWAVIWLVEERSAYYKIIRQLAFCLSSFLPQLKLEGGIFFIQ